MRILISNAHVIDPSSAHHSSSQDILVDNGIIQQIGKDIDPTGADEVIEGEGVCVSSGWIDLFATIGDPGMEHRETVSSALDAAANGGFTRIAVSPESLPVTDNKSGIEYLKKQASGHAVELLPLGALTKGLAGNEMAEMYDMVRSGACGMSNGKHTIGNSKLMQVALLYAQRLGVPFYVFAEDARMTEGTQVHEGEVSTELGLRGAPALAEELAVTRDLYIVRYTETPVHFSHVTTAGSVQLIREAKAQGMPVTASVPVHHLLYTDKEVQAFDSHYKLRPPLRSSHHVEALWQGLRDGTIDAIISDHEPLEVEAKFMEFGQATPGVTALETLFPALLRGCNGKADIALLINKLTCGPRKVLGMDNTSVAEGSPAELTVFSLEMEWKYGADTAASLSANSPLWGETLTGRAVAIIHRDRIAFGKL